MSEQELMQAIKAKWGTLLDETCKTSSVSPTFLAALIANESGGDPNAKRFEPGVLSALWEVLLARKTAYGSITRAALLSYVFPPPEIFSGSTVVRNVNVPDNRTIIPASMQHLDDLAHSWGLTQIMGYESIPFHLDSTDRLKDPPLDLATTIKMLVDFSNRFGLDLLSDFAQLFSCWNTGRPHGTTADPQYIPNGMERMRIYGDLP